MSRQPSRRIDAHCHLWDLARGDYGWLDVSNPDLKPIAKNFELSDLLAADLNTPAVHYVLVQAAPTVAETEFLLHLSDQHEQIGAVVGWVDLAGNGAQEQLERLSLNPKFKGVRPMLQDIDDVNWINTAPRSDAIEALKEHGLCFDALVLPQHLSAFKEFALAHPSIPMVIDHAAKPALASNHSDPRHEMWRIGMAELAEETNVLCKISGLLTELSVEQREQPVEYLKPVVHDLLNWFGPDRLMWGSDWPVLNLAASYEQWQSVCNTLLSELDEKSSAKIFSGTAENFYALNDEK